MKMQAYSDPKRENDPHALPDLEVFHMSAGEIKDAGWEDEDGEPLEAGWYWWSCFPGCMPDSEPNGPFETQEQALEDARDGLED
jgi:hypothetical protein